MRRFNLNRHRDISGISGTGIVAEGVEFTDGTTVVRWLRPTGGSASPTTVVHDSIDNVVALHGHDGATQIEWTD